MPMSAALSFRTVYSQDIHFDVNPRFASTLLLWKKSKIPALPTTGFG